MPRKVALILSAALCIVTAATLVALASMKDAAAPTTGPLALQREVDELSHFSDTSLPLADRVAAVQELAGRGDEHSRSLLMELAEQKTYLNYAAVEALAGCPGAEVTDFLRGKLDDPDARVVCAAIGALAQQAGEQAVEAISSALRRAAERHEGYEWMIRAAAVQALAAIASSKAVPILSEELERNSDLEHGSDIVAALDRIDDASASEALLGYADRLATALPDDAQARRFVEQKIMEARAAALGFTDAMSLQ